MKTKPPGLCSYFPTLADLIFVTIESKKLFMSITDRMNFLRRVQIGSCSAQ